MPRWYTLMMLLALGWLKSTTWAQSWQDQSSVSWSQSAGWAKVYSAGHGAPAPVAQGPGQMVFRELPDDTGWVFEETPLESILLETFRHAYFRVEYLLWDLSDPGHNVLSAPTTYPTFIYPPHLVRNPANPSQLIPPAVFSNAEDPTTATTTNLSLNGLSTQYQLPAVYHISSQGQVASNAFRPSMVVATLPTTSDAILNDNNGIRGTFGLVMPTGTLEASVFALQTATTGFGPRPLLFLDRGDIDDSDFDGVMGDGITQEFLPTFEAVAQAILVDGQVPTTPIWVSLWERQTDTNPQLPTPSDPAAQFPNPPGVPATPLNQPLLRGDNLRIIWAVRDPMTGEYRSSYHAELQSTVWGAEGNYIPHYWDEGAALTIVPTLGFRYVNFRESLRQRGFYTYSSIDPLTSTLVHQDVFRRIDSATNNNLYGPQLGLRAEFDHPWFAIGVQPKVMMGLNSYTADLHTENVLRPGDRNQELKLDRHTFGIAGDLQVYSRIKLTSYMNVFVGYNLLWLGLTTRPADNIVYNARTVTTHTVPVDPRDQSANPPTMNVPVSEADLESDFRLDPRFSGVLLQGLSVGGEIRY
ncbi:MAG: hypothetical protein KatS3mg114_1039 [Planctomycetaceae bacterium]|nr:MAG: hypothetical protein KatS3mg114_1039 [Planctomycetaceae bacterium]